jgi:predicted kinase
MSKILYIIRGLPGSGKSTLGAALTAGPELARHGHVYSADDYFINPSTAAYEFNPGLLGEAHAMCQARVRDALEAGVGAVAVANTFSQKWEAAPYFEMADSNGYTVVVIECQNEFGSVHGVPAASIAAMDASWEKYILPTKTN